MSLAEIRLSGFGFHFVDDGYEPIIHDARRLQVRQHCGRELAVFQIRSKTGSGRRNPVLQLQARYPPELFGVIGYEDALL